MFFPVKFLGIIVHLTGAFGFIVILLGGSAVVQSAVGQSAVGQSAVPWLHPALIPIFVELASFPCVSAQLLQAPQYPPAVQRHAVW